jgi:single-strand DNA-binding protein
MTIDAAFYGTVVRDAEAKISKNGKAYARFTVRDGDGDAAQFVSVMYFGADTGEIAAKIAKGTRIYVEGTLRLDRWEKDGEPRVGLSVMSWHARVPAIGQHKSKKAAAAPTDHTAAAPVQQTDDFPSDNIPF